MSGASCTEQKLEGVWCHSLQHPAINSLLQEYQSLLQGLIGPQGGTLLVQHIGGLDTFVNSSSDLVKRLRPHHPCLKFIQCLMTAQEAAHGCCGLYVGALCTSLLRGLLEAGLPVRIIRDVSAALMEHVLDQLEERPQNYVAKLDISQLDQILAFVGTSIGSKNLGLSSAEKNHLKVKVVEAFLATVPAEDDYSDGLFGTVTITTVDGRPATEAKVLPGVLYRDIDPNYKLIHIIKQRLDANRLGTAHHQNINHSRLENNKNQEVTGSNNNEESQTSIKKCFSGDNNAPHSMINAMSKYMCNNLQEENSDLDSSGTKQHNSNLKLILFNVPLAFEKSETELLKFTGGLPNKEYYNSVVLSGLRRLVACTKIDVIACQKVVSDVIKFELERDGVLVLERLGTVLTDSLRQLTGCSVVSDVTGLLEASQCCNSRLNNISETEEKTAVNHYVNSIVGQLTDITLVEVNGRMYLQLNNEHDQRCASEPRSDDRPQIVPGERDQCDGNEKTAGSASKVSKRRGSSASEGKDAVDGDYCQAADSSKGSQVVTLLLPAMSSLMAENVKVVVEEALKGLRLLAVQPLVLPSGGCVEAGLAAIAAACGGVGTVVPTPAGGSDCVGTVATAATSAADWSDCGGTVATAAGTAAATASSATGGGGTAATTTSVSSGSTAALATSTPAAIADEAGSGAATGISTTGARDAASTEAEAAAVAIDRLSRATDGRRGAASGKPVESASERQPWARDLEASPSQIKQVCSIVSRVFANLSAVLSRGPGAGNGSLTSSTFHLGLHSTSGHLFHLPLPHAATTVTSPCVERCSCGAFEVPSYGGSDCHSDVSPLRNLYEMNFGSLDQTTDENNDKNETKTPPPSSTAPFPQPPTLLEATVSLQPPPLSQPPSLPPVFTVRQHSLIDSYHGKLNALRLAFEGVSQLLDVDYCVFDR